MRARPLSLTLMVLLLSAFVPTSQAAPAPLFSETTIVEDKEDDFQSNNALDLGAVYIGEKHSYNADTQTGEETLSFRFQVKDITAIPCGSTIRYDVSFKVDGQQKTLYAGYSSESPANYQNACAVKPADGSGSVAYRQPLNSLLLTVTRASIPAPVGSVLTDIVATSQLVTPAQNVAGDMAPYDNQNQPSSTYPTSGLKTYTMMGTYPFVTVTPTSPTEQYSVGGAEVEYEFQFFSHTEVKDDNIRVRFTYPSGWSISPSSGRTGSDPEGQLTGGNGGVPRDFSFTLSSSGAASDGDQVSVLMEVITDSGGHVIVPTVTTVSGAKIVDPAFNFTLLTPGPFTAEETAPIRVSVADALGPLDGVVVSVDLIQNGKRLSTTPLTAATNGVYQGSVRFPTGGTYTLDAYVSSMKPSPHHEFVVKAEKGGLAPGVPVWAIALVVVGAALLRRRD